MDAPLTQSQLEACVRTVVNDFDTSDRAVEWPDCYDVSEAIRDALLETNEDISPDSLVIESYYPVEGFLHHALCVHPPTSDSSYIIDAAFAQFATETETPIDIAPRNEIESIVIVRKPRYIFEG